MWITPCRVLRHITCTAVCSSSRRISGLLWPADDTARLSATALLYLKQKTTSLPCLFHRLLRETKEVVKQKAETSRVKSLGFRSLNPSSIIGCVALGKLLRLSGLPFFIWKMELITVPTSWDYHENWMRQCLHLNTILRLIVYVVLFF